MSAQDKKINIDLVKNTLCSPYPEHSVGLGNISLQDYEQIKNIFATCSSKDSKCMQDFRMKYQETMIFGIHDKAVHINHLDISGMSWMCEGQTPLCKNCLDKTDYEKMNICAHNMRNGNCCDPLIRRTFGAALFPQFYAKEK